MIHVQLIGATSVRTDSREFTGRDFGGIKPRRLLELLALALGSPVSKERLADLMWEGTPPTSYLSTLESYISLLRGRLQPGVPARASAIRTVNGGYLLDPEQVTVDARTVRNLTAQAQTLRPGAALPLLREALELAAGELLPGSEGAAWADAVRQEHLVLRVETATSAALHALHLGLPGLAVTLADEALSLDPLAEHACRCAMQGLWATGRTAESLRRHADLRRVLSDELGADPAPQTQVLLQRLLRDEAPPVIPVQRRETDRLLAVAGTPESTVDMLAGAVVVALRHSSRAVTEHDDDPELLRMLEQVLRHLHGDAVLDRLTVRAV